MMLEFETDTPASDVAALLRDVLALELDTADDAAARTTRGLAPAPRKDIRDGMEPFDDLVRACGKVHGALVEAVGELERFEGELL